MTVLFSYLVIPLLFFSRLTISFSHYAVPTLHLTFLFSHMVVPLFFFLTIDGFIITLCSSNITFDNYFVTFSGSFICFSNLMVPLSHCVVSISNMTVLLSHIVVSFIFSQIWWFHCYIKQYQHCIYSIFVTCDNSFVTLDGSLIFFSYIWQFHPHIM